MTRDEAATYAKRWAGDWNRLDLDALLEHLEDGIIWSSPKAMQALPNSSLEMTALRAATEADR